jgi:hypothetical protein
MDFEHWSYEGDVWMMTGVRNWVYNLAFEIAPEVFIRARSHCKVSGSEHVEITKKRCETRPRKPKGNIKTISNKWMQIQQGQWDPIASNSQPKQPILGEEEGGAK